MTETVRPFEHAGKATVYTQKTVGNDNVLIPHSKIYETSGEIIDSNGNVLSVKKAFANIAASTTDGNIVTAVASKKIRVISVVALTGATATNITFNSKPGGAGTAISMTFQNGANGGEVLGKNADGWFETVSGEGLTATTGAGSTTGVQVNYIEVP